MILSKWWPPFKVAILHSSGSGFNPFNENVESDSDSYGGERMMSKRKKIEKLSRRKKMPDQEFDLNMPELECLSESDAISESDMEYSRESLKTNSIPKEIYRKPNNLRNDQAALVDDIFTNGHILVTTFAGLRVYDALLIDKKWSYVVLDEGHKIRNPDAGITIKCKQLKVSLSNRFI